MVTVAYCIFVSAKLPEVFISCIAKMEVDGKLTPAAELLGQWAALQQSHDSAMKHYSVV